MAVLLALSSGLSALSSPSVTPVAHLADHFRRVWRDGHRPAQCGGRLRGLAGDHWAVAHDHRLGFSVARDDDFFPLGGALQQRRKLIFRRARSPPPAPRMPPAPPAPSKASSPWAALIPGFSSSCGSMWPHEASRQVLSHTFTPRRRDQSCFACEIVSASTSGVSACFGSSPMP
jgi:hypothetical protein